MNLFSNIRNKPILQAGFCLILALIIQVIIYFAAKIGGNEVNSTEIWIICPALLLFFVLFNVVFGFEQKSIGIYYRDSIYGLLGLLGVDILFSQILTGQSVFEVKSVSWILFVFCIVYLVFVSILNLIRFIMHLVLKQDKNIQEDIRKD